MLMYTVHCTAYKSVAIVTTSSCPYSTRVKIRVLIASVTCAKGSALYGLRLVFLARIIVKFMSLLLY